MELSDSLLSRIDNEKEFKEPINALICYNKTVTGKKLSELAAYFVLTRSTKSSITYLQLKDAEAKSNLGEDTNHYNIFKRQTDNNEKEEEVTVRSFEKISDNYILDILNATKEHNSNFIMFGIESDQLDINQCQKYTKLQQTPAISDTEIFGQFTTEEAKMLDCFSSLFELSTETTGVFINNNLKNVEKIFIPILAPSDMLVLPYVYVRFSQKYNVKMMIWDAIGATESTPKLQKLYQSIIKKSDDKIYFWDTNKKIHSDFINKQDLFIVGHEGWERLIAANLPWLNSLPSTMILKGKST